MNNVQETDRDRPVRTERLDRLKTVLIDASERRVCEAGLKSLRARDLAAEAGCSVGQIYNVFPDLDTVVLEVNARTLRLLEGVLSPSGGTQVFPDADAAVSEIVRLAGAYLRFASDHRERWRALFQHTMAGGAVLPEWYAAEKARMFGAVDAPLRRLRPDLPEADLGLLVRTLFSATHGIVDLGLDEKLDALPPDVLRSQLEMVVRAMVLGLLTGAPD